MHFTTALRLRGYKKVTRHPPGGQLENTVDKNREEGAKRQAKGSMKEGAGKLTGDRSQEAKGKMEKNLGKGQREAGKAADRARDQQ